MREQTIAFATQGRHFNALLVESEDSPATVRQPGVLVLHGGAGIGEHERERARRLAALGYVALVPDLFGERFTSREHGIDVITKLVSDPTALRARAADALSALASEPGVDRTRLAAIGFCFGGLAALELARSGADLRAVVCFHGKLTSAAPAEVDAVRAAILVCTGAADPFIGRDQRTAFEEEMTHARADWQLNVYANAMHSFTEQPLPASQAQRPGMRYDEAADHRSWEAMRALLDERLEGHGK
jgi:dienelactone hydrolase